MFYYVKILFRFGVFFFGILLNVCILNVTGRTRQVGYTEYIRIYSVSTTVAYAISLPPPTKKRLHRLSLLYCAFINNVCELVVTYFGFIKCTYFALIIVFIYRSSFLYLNYNAEYKRKFKSIFNNISTYVELN